ncbi:MAG: Ltp family lipoprotein [Lachnospiraceae bacterium]|nr:Ltp family lipoprotein [Lachnospiraceae bacterium]
MFCTKCGKPLEEGARFCSNCGAPLEEVPTLEIPTEEVLEPVEEISESTVQQPKTVSYQPSASDAPAAPEKSKKKKVWIIVGIAIAVFILLVFGVVFGVKSFFNKIKEQHIIENKSGEEYIDVVRDGYMFEYGYQTVGDAFEDFFTNPEWKYFQASDGDHMVQFEGGCLYDGEETDFLAQFIVDDYDFELYAIELDGVVQDPELNDVYLIVIFEDVSPNGMEEDPTKGSSNNSGSSTTSQKEALESAHDYITYLAFSYTGLIEQLEWEGFSEQDATYAADNCGADWYEQAAKCAKSYLDSLALSKEELMEQLEYEGFTYDQAVYGVTSVGY